MRFAHFIDPHVNPDSAPFEIVERKGIGHPDSLADIIAESFSNKYSTYCKENFGTYLNHWFDKVLLSGGEADLAPGSCIVKKNPRVYLFGRVTRITDTQIPVEDLFKETVHSVFSRIFGISESQMPAITIDTNSGVGADHSKTYYEFNAEKKTAQFETVSNDTIFTVGYAPYSKLERLVIDVENYANSPEFKKTFPAVGADVKVMARRLNLDVDLTICVPFIAERTPSWEYYSAQKVLIAEALQKFVTTSEYRVTIHFNTKDLPGRGYLTTYGTAFDKGDCGAVGRGNRISGIISGNRPESQEAPAGKNPLVQSGKIYAVCAHKVSRAVFEKTGHPVRVTITTNNGSLLSEPELTISHHLSEQNSTVDSGIVEEEARKAFSSISTLSEEVIHSDPIQNFKDRKF